MNCTACNQILGIGLTKWHLVCPKCGYECSLLEPRINEEKFHEQIDERKRASGLEVLRKENFRQLVAILKTLKPEKDCHLLDVGSAHGWFLEEATDHFTVLGIEPDQVVYASSTAKGLPQRLGFFPEALKDGELFDIIAFNDVIEHISSIRKILEACHHRLKDGGLLLLNVPSSRGFFYRLSKVLLKMGMPQGFDRMWQKNLPSPHVHYFHESNLKCLVESTGFIMRKSGTLPSLSRNGLLTRISYANSWPKPLNYFFWFILLASIPLINDVFERDMIYMIFERKVK